MEFLKAATLAPLNNLGPVGMMVAVIIWVVVLYMGTRYGYGAKRIGSPLYLLAFLVSIVMVVGLILMLFTNMFSNEKSLVFQFYGLLQLLTFGAVGGFIALMVASCGFLFGVLIRLLDNVTKKAMR